MSEDKSSNPRIGSDFLEFLQDECGGQEAAETKFRRHLIRTTFNGRPSTEVSMGAIMEFIEAGGWTDWFRSMNIVEFIGIFGKESHGTTIKRPSDGAESSRPHTSATSQNVEERITVVMAEFEKTPWISKPNIGKLLGLKSTPTIDKVMNEMFARGLIKKFRGRTLFYAKANEACPPPT
jgi:hypothetical protein